VARVSFLSPFSARVQELSNSFSRTLLSVSEASVGCWVVFLQRNHELAVELARFCALRGRGDFLVTQPCKRHLVVHHQRTCLGGGHEFLLVRGLQRSIAFVQVAQFCLVGIRQIGAGMHELHVIDFEELQRFRIELERVTRIINRLYAREELRVQIDRILMGGELRRLFRLHLVERVVGVGLDYA